MELGDWGCRISKYFCLAAAPFFLIVPLWKNEKFTSCVDFLHLVQESLKERRKTAIKIAIKGVYGDIALHFEPEEPCLRLQHTEILEDSFRKIPAGGDVFCR